MGQIDLSSLIETGKSIKDGLVYVEPGPNIIRTFSVYSLANQDQYYSWKECVIKFLQIYSKEDVNRFVQYADEFEKCHVPHYISNMIGILEACKAFPSKQLEQLEETTIRESEIEAVLGLEQSYERYIQSAKEAINTEAAIDAFHKWHAAACVLFDKYLYASDEDLLKFQDVDGVGNGYTLRNEYHKIYTPYQKLIHRLKEGRNIRTFLLRSQPNNANKKKPLEKINIFISYAHTDKKWLERLKKHLKVLSRYFDNIEYWDDTKIKGGDKWKKEIEDAISKANVAILLVSTDFLSSDFITTDELPPLLRKAEEEGTRILPLIVSPCAFTLSEVSDFQAVNNPEKTLADLEADEAAIERTYLELIKNIQELI